MTGPDSFDPALKALLDADIAPPLPSGFAERATAAAQARRAPLPKLRRPAAQRWRAGRRIALGLLAAGLLSSAAAATGMLEQVGITLPQPVQQFVDDVANAVTGGGRDSATGQVAAAPAAPPVSAQGQASNGPIDNPEELETAFRRIDTAREERRSVRREQVDGRIDQAIERRRAQGLPVPSEQEEARLRERLEQARARREADATVRREALREDLRERVEQGEEIVLPADQRRGPRVGQRLSDEQREALRERLADRLQAEPTPAPAENLP